MTITTEEQTTPTQAAAKATAKRQSKDANAARQRRRQEARVTRDERLGRIANAEAAARRKIDADGVAARKKVWSDFRAAMSAIDKTNPAAKGEQP